MIRQVPWFERSFNFDFSVHLFPVIFSRLEGTLFHLNSLLKTADEDLCSHYSSGWSVKEHIGHLADLEVLWWARLTDFLEYKQVLTAADLTNKKTNEGRHNEKTLEQLLVEFARERQRILETTYDFGTQLLQLTSIHPRLNKSMRLVDSLYFVAEHDDHHLAIISELLRKEVSSYPDAL